MKKIKSLIITAMFLISLLIVINPVSAQPTNVAIFQDGNPWGFTSNQNILTAHGISYTIYPSAQIGIVNLSGFDKVIISCDQSNAFYAAVEANRAWFENYVNNGGTLEIHAADNGWAGGSWPTGILPCGFTYSQWYGDTVNIASPGHTILTTPNNMTDAELDNWGWSYHGCFFPSYPSGSQIILTEGDTGSVHPVLIIAKYGKGCVIASGQTLEFAAHWGYSNLLENVILFMCPEEAVFANPIAAFIPVKNYHLRQVNTCLECITENLPEDVPGDVQALLDEMQEHIDNANTTGNTIYANNELLKALKCCEDIQEKLGITCPL